MFTAFSVGVLKGWIIKRNALAENSVSALFVRS